MLEMLETAKLNGKLDWLAWSAVSMESDHANGS